MTRHDTYRFRQPSFGSSRSATAICRSFERRTRRRSLFFSRALGLEHSFKLVCMVPWQASRKKKGNLCISPMQVKRVGPTRSCLRLPRPLAICMYLFGDGGARKEHLKGWDAAAKTPMSKSVTADLLSTLRSFRLFFCLFFFDFCFLCHTTSSQISIIFFVPLF